MPLGTLCSLRLFPRIRCRCERRLTGTCMAGLATAESANRKLLVSHVLIKDTAKAPLIFDDLEKKLSSGRSSFTDLAREHSECSQSSHMGGQLGWLQRGTYFPEFEAAVFALGITSGSITRAQTSIGWHLIKVDDVREEALVQQMDPTELLEVLGNPGLNEDVQFIDVREEWEFQTAKLQHFMLYPLSRFQEWSLSLKEDLDPNKETIVLCHHGVRSMKMAEFLVSELGFRDVRNVTGGIDAFSLADKSVPRY